MPGLTIDSRCLCLIFDVKVKSLDQLMREGIDLALVAQVKGVKLLRSGLTTARMACSVASMKRPNVL